MAQDTALLRYLLKWARRAPWSWSQRDLTFQFDWTDDYISSNATIWRTGYDMNVSGNVTTGSDGDGDYIQFNGNRDTTAVSGTFAAVNTTSAMTWTQTQDFTMKVRIKINSLPPNNNVGIFWSWGGWTNWFTASIWANGSLSSVQFTLRTWASPVTYSWPSLTIGVLYDLYLVWVASDQKFYCYRGISWAASSLLNTGWTSYASTFTFSGLRLWDDAHGGGNTSSNSKYVYHACIRSKALTQAEIDADIALWNTTKQDPSIVAYYVPENLQYNTQYWTNPNTFGDTWWTIGSNASVITNNAVAPDWTTTASTYTINVLWTAVTNAINQNVTTISWSSIASKTFIVKAFVRVTSWSNSFRLQCSHTGVADYYSWNQTATTTRQEFTFTQTFTSSTSWTGIRYWLTSDTLFSAWAFEVAKVRLFLVNETLRDESPNIWWFIGRKTPIVMSARVKLWTDAADTPTSQVIFKTPRHYIHIRWTTNIVYRRSETTLAARVAWLVWTAILWTWNRNKVNIVVYKYRDWTGRLYEAYVNGVKTTGGQTAYSNTTRPSSTIYTTQLLIWKDSTAVYYNWNIRDARIYTFTWSFTDADALAIYNWWEPTSAWVTKYLHYRPPVGEVGTTTQDQSTNDRDWTLNGGVTRNYI